VIVMIAGASGVGKSELAHRLAVRLGIALVEVDDIVEALQALTTSAQLPALHRWDTEPTARELPPKGIVGRCRCWPPGRGPTWWTGRCSRSA
jgi:broad-specificity NMP kinase